MVDQLQIMHGAIVALKNEDAAIVTSTLISMSVNGAISLSYSQVCVTVVGTVV